MNRRNSNESLIHNLSFNNKGKLIWTSSFHDLQAFVEEVPNLTGNWSSPGGNSKMHQDRNQLGISIRWYANTQTITVSDTEKGEIENKLDSVASTSKGRSNTVDIARGQ